MYSFTIKDNGTDLDIVITRALLAIAAIAAIVYRGGEYYFLNLLSSVTLVLAAIFIKLLLVKFRLNRLLLLTAAALILFIATHSIAFAVILLAYGWLVKFLNNKPVIIVTNESIIIHKLFASPAYQWREFSNVVLKDHLLTLDFKNNKLLQVNIDETQAPVDEGAFNEYCKKFIPQV